MSGRFAGRVALVSGASRGIGRLLCERLVSEGARVAGIARSEDRLAELKTALGDAFLSIAGDIASEPVCGAAVRQTIEHFGGLDVLINNAGTSGVQKFARDMTPQEFTSVIDVNLNAAFYLVHHSLPTMMEQKSGSIVNISSFTGKRAMSKRLAYATSKMGLVGLTRTLALELGPFNIRVNTVSPGPVEGERVEEVIDAMVASQSLDRDAVRDLLLDLSPLHRMATADDIVRMALYLASDDGRAMTGQDINVTAGIVMY
jgi:NAD(P)-dependent dehydrogenase (short-subunit alcohol dehydrogenase family)